MNRITGLRVSFVFKLKEIIKRGWLAIPTRSAGRVGSSLAMGEIAPTK
jgi:hypothetical protein